MAASVLDRGRMLICAQAGGAKPIAARCCAAWGWVGGVYPSAPFTARTAASGGHCAFTRAARSAGLNFAVILLSKAMDVERDHLIHRGAVPLPLEGKDLTRLKLGRVCEYQAPTSNSSLLTVFSGKGDRSAVDEVIPPDVNGF